jgi:hypothetical protein
VDDRSTSRGGLQHHDATSFIFHVTPVRTVDLCATFNRMLKFPIRWLVAFQLDTPKDSSATKNRLRFNLGAVFAIFYFGAHAKFDF